MKILEENYHNPIIFDKNNPNVFSAGEYEKKDAPTQQLSLFIYITSLVLQKERGVLFRDSHFKN